MSRRKPSSADSLAELRRRGLDIGVVIDVGVLNGTAPLMQVFPDRRHLLFEPVAEHADAIRRNYAAIEHELVTAAVSDADGFIELALSSVTPGEAITHSRMADDGDGARTVPMVSLDGFLADRAEPAPYLLKIDVDGAEARVLDGARLTLEATAAVMIEITVLSFATLVPKLLGAGFVLVDIVDLSYYDGRLAQFDGIFLRADVAQHPGMALFRGPFDIARWENYTP